MKSLLLVAVLACLLLTFRIDVAAETAPMLTRPRLTTGGLSSDAAVSNDQVEFVEAQYAEEEEGLQMEMIEQREEVSELILPSNSTFAASCRSSPPCCSMLVFRRCPGAHSAHVEGISVSRVLWQHRRSQGDADHVRGDIDTDARGGQDRQVQAESQLVAEQMHLLRGVWA